MLPKTILPPSEMYNVPSISYVLIVYGKYILCGLFSTLVAMLRLFILLILIFAREESHYMVERHAPRDRVLATLYQVPFVIAVQKVSFMHKVKCLSWMID